MLSKLCSQLTYANVIASIALFIALGGTSYSLVTGAIDSREIENNSVRSKDIRNNGARGKDIRNETVRSRDVRNGTLLAEDLKAGEFPTGERGPEGPRGPQGEQGEQGAAATKLFAYIRDPGSSDLAVVEYGSGVADVADHNNGQYTVTFNRSVANCVVHAISGTGDPAGPALATTASFPIVFMHGDGADEVQFTFLSDAGLAVNTSFLVSAFC